MKTKPITFLRSLSFLFLFSGFVYGEEPAIKRKYYDSGKLKSEVHLKNGKQEGIKTGWYETGEKWSESHYKNGKPEGLETHWYKNGRKKYSQRHKNEKLVFEGNFIYGVEVAGSDFWSNYIFKHYPSSSVTQLRAYSCVDLSSMCNWVEFKDAVLDKNCEQVYSKDSSEYAACLKVIGRDDIFFGKLKSCEKDNLNKNCLNDSRYKYSCDGNYSTKIERSVCKEIISIFDYCESIVYSDFKKKFPSCHKVIRDRKAFSKTGCKKFYGDSGPAIFYRCMELFDNGRASGSRTKKGLNAAYKVYCKDITRRKEKEMEIYSKEFSCKMQTFWSNEESTLCEKEYENTCFSKASNVW